MKEMVGGCCVCSDERGWPDNPLVYCDGNGCTVAVHQACYGIVTVPTGPWYCRKCESPDNKGKVRCELCPSKSGALKRADSGGWAHVVCALYIPEVRFGNVTSMEPIVLRLIPSERYNKTCYICMEMGKSNRAGAGACMQCNKSGCKQQFHVTCAQGQGLLCEEAGNYLDNVKYCGYCEHHYSKLKKGSNVKTVPPYKPVVATVDCPSSDSSGEREGEASPTAGGSGTPTHAGKVKGGGRKSSLSGAVVAGKSTPNSKTPTNTSQPIARGTNSSVDVPDADTSSEAEGSAGARKHRAYKHKRKGSPARRGSSAGDSGPAGSGGSKASTPAPSPQHVAAETERAKGGSTPSGGKAAPAASSPASPAARPEQGSVISSVAAATTCSVVLTPVTTTVTTVLQSSAKPAAAPGMSVITNTEAAENRQTKKRKAAVVAVATAGEAPPPAASMWESCTTAPPDSPAPNDATDKTVKKPKTDGAETSMTSHYATQPPAPPPSLSPSQPSPRLLSSPMPGPSGVGQPSNIRFSQAEGVVLDRAPAPPSLLVSVPLPAVASANHPASIVTNVLSDVSPSHFFHQNQGTFMEHGVSPLAPVAQPGRSTWGGLSVSYEMQQDPTKQGGMAAVGSKDGGQMPSTMRGHKKRAAMDRAAVAIHNTAHHSMQIPGQQSQQAFSAVRRPEPTPPPPPPPPPVYQETIKESPPSSPISDKPLSSMVEARSVATAPHMLGNELNPASGAAALFQQQLKAELSAHAHGQRAVNAFVPPPLINKGAGSTRSTPSGAQSLDQLLERQWEQGSQFLMEQAQHFDIASLLSCLHQLRTENARLEDHVFTLLQRRDHLLAVNARLAIPLAAPTMSLPSEQPRGARENGGQLMRAPPPPSAREPAAGPPALAHPSALDRTQQVCGSLERSHQQACTPQERPHQMQMVREGQQKPS